jgi:hypothetical protein
MMRSGVAHLSETIAAHLREWEPAPAFVELAIFETDDPPAIAQMLAAFCLKLLGAPVRRGLFHQSSIGSVTGIELADDRAVVVKAHQPERSHGLLSEIVRIQSHLSQWHLCAADFGRSGCAWPGPRHRGAVLQHRRHR